MWMWSKRSLSDQENGKIIMLLLVIKSVWENSVIFYIYLHIINIGYYIFYYKIFYKLTSLYLKIPHHQKFISISYLILLNYLSLVIKKWKTLISVWHFLSNTYLLSYLLYSILCSIDYSIPCVSLFFVLFAMLITLDIQAAKAHCWLLFSSLVVDLPSS